MIVRQNKPESARVAPRRHSRFRRAAFRGAESLFTICGGRRLYRRTWLAAGRFLLREEIVHVPGLAADLDGLTIAQLSDLHAGPFLRAGDLADVVAATNALAPDLTVITGDFISHHWSDALHVLDDLAALSAPLGVYAVFGNHDYKDRLEGRIESAYAERGMHFLRNACARIPVGSAALGLVGLEDLEEGREVDLQAARAGLEAPGHAAPDLEVVLCHNPMGAPAIARDGCALILSGHTHGGQIDLPFLRELGPQHPGLRIELGSTTLLVSRGLGVVGAPLRYRAPTEVVVVRLVRA